MGQCYGKGIPPSKDDGGGDGEYHPRTPHRLSPAPSANGVSPSGVGGATSVSSVKNTPTHSSSSAANPWPSPYPQASPGPWPSPFPHGGGGSSSPLPPGVSPSPARSTPRRFFRWPFPPPSPAKHIKASIARRQGPHRPRDSPIPEDGGGPGEAAEGVDTNGAGEQERPLDKSFGYAVNFGAKYEVGKEVGRGHFGHTCSARAKKGEIKGQLVAVKIISKAKVCRSVSISIFIPFILFCLPCQRAPPSS
uniref:CDPK-related protein kinase n=1 Tax=Anthurium amnicola TaxID=1678845 RepID=A0A1D1XLQ4_9ARAE